ncbi:disease resistance protein, partial [Trifolium medium]|nr:disease resistance protein [Trifolium medium]
MTLELKKDSHLTGINKILSLSYDDLPFHLKSCLMYFGMYPEDYIVKSKRLIRQWIAEGFVKEESGNTLEEVAEGYLTELIHRSLVQVSSVRIDGKTKNESQFLSEDFMWRIFTEYRRLKVLEFEVSEVKLLNTNILHENLGSLIHLKYLSFVNSFGETQFELPKSIAMLQNLETLVLRHKAYYQIPKVVSKLRKLQHLMGFRMSLFQLKGGIGGMESLQTLSSVQIDDYDDGLELIKELGKLRQLRKLSLFHVMEDHISTLSSSLNEMQHLENLSIHCRHFTDLHLNPPPSMLRSLKLRGMLEKFPEWILQLQNLVKLKLELSNLEDDPIKLLENMQNLLSLQIDFKAYK